VTRARPEWPRAAGFAGPPDVRQLADWDAADAAARPARVARLRARFEAAAIDAYFGVRPEHMRYLTGFALDEGEEKSAGASGQFFVSGDEIVVLADSRYSIQVRREAPDARLAEVYGNLPARWPDLVASIGARRIAVEAGFVSHAQFLRLAAAAPEVFMHWMVMEIHMLHLGTPLI
jgi:Xaa-Pro aminopeptidase